MFSLLFEIKIFSDSFRRNIQIPIILYFKLLNNILTKYSHKMNANKVFEGKLMGVPQDLKWVNKQKPLEYSLLRVLLIPYQQLLNNPCHNPYFSNI